jgi:hypothetical protein
MVVNEFSSDDELKAFIMKYVDEDETPQLGEEMGLTDMSKDAIDYEIGDLYLNEECGLTYRITQKSFLFERFGYKTYSYKMVIVAIDDSKWDNA